MVSKKNFIAYVNIFKQLAFLIKTALIKAVTFSYLAKSFHPYNFKTNILNRISESHTNAISSYFITTIIIFCLTAITLSYYEQRYKFEQELLNKTKFAYMHIEETINNYQSSLDALAQIIRDQGRIDTKKITQLLKLSYTTDEHINLLPLAWHPIAEPNKSFNAHGSVMVTPDVALLERLTKNLDQVTIYDQLDKQGKVNLIIVFPVTQQNTITKDNSLVGYLKIPIKVSLILQALYHSLSADDLLKISRQDESIYFAKQKGLFKIIHDPSLINYQFAHDISFPSSPYKIAVGQTEQIINNTIQTALLRCGIILSVGITMLLIYNYVERKKIKKQCGELFTEEVSLLQQKMQDLKIELTGLDQKNVNITKQMQDYSDSVKIISSIEQKIKQGYSNSIDRIQDLLNFKHYKNDEELTIDLVKKMFGNIFKLSENLRHNIVSKEDDVAEIELDCMFTEILTIFAPIITQRSIIVINKIGKVTIKINELILKQVLISLLIRSLYFITSDSTITISAHKNISKNTVMIEIIDNGIGFDDILFKGTSYRNKNDLFPSMMNIQLEHGIIENLVKEMLTGDLKITSMHNGNQITLLIPIERDREDKVIPFPKIAAR